VTRRRGVFWPLILIAIGLVFLLANYGFITPVSWVAIANLWPLLLILIGIDIAFARRWPLAALVAEVAIIAGGLALVAANPTYGFPFPPFGSRDGGGETDLSVPRGSASSLSLHLNGGAATYHVGGGASGLFEAHSSNPDLRLRRSDRGDRADLRIDQTGLGGPGLRFGNNPSTTIDVRVASDVPTSLEVNMGAGELTLDLSSIRATDARVNTGAATLLVVLPRPSGDIPIGIGAGASSIAIQVPEGVEARITTTGGVLTLRSDNPRLGQAGAQGGCVACGSSVETPGYASARDRVTVTIRAGASSVTVR